MYPPLIRIRGWQETHNTAEDTDNIPKVSGNTLKGIDNTPGRDLAMNLRTASRAVG